MNIDIPAKPDVPGWMRWLSRIGFGAKGVVYLIVGGLAMQGVGQASKESALSEIAQQPFGKVLLAIVALGLLAYALWRLASGLVDPDDDADDDAKGIGKRVGYVASGVAYAALAWAAAGIVSGSGSGGGGGDGTQDWTGKLLQVNFGQWLVGLAAAGVLVGAAYQLKQAWDDRGPGLRLLRAPLLRGRALPQRRGLSPARLVAARASRHVSRPSPVQAVAGAGRSSRSLRKLAATSAVPSRHTQAMAQ